MKKPLSKQRILVIMLILLLLSGCQADLPAEPEITTEGETAYTGQIYLYGEAHGVKAIYEREFEIWKSYYEEQGMRHLFVELPYYTAAYLNLWMEASDDVLLMAVYEDMVGTANYNPDFLEFKKRIKAEMPETIFHGTDVGHQYDTTGKRYLTYLESENLKASEAYAITKEAIEQGKYYYKHDADDYRENKMAENFLRALETVGHADIMGIYGSAHTGLDAMNYTNQVDGMAKQLVALYGSQVHSEDLSWIAKDIEPLRVDTIEIEGETYEASYFGKQDMTGFKNFKFREVWRLESAYDTFKSYKKTGDVLPYNNYPMLVEVGQVFVIDYGKTDGSVTRTVHISDGALWQDMPSTEEVEVE